MSRLRGLRLHPVSAALSVLLLVLSVWEIFASDELPGPVTLPRLVGAVVPPLLVAFTRSAPERCAALLVAAHLLESVPGPPSGTLGAGFATLTVPFFVTAWAARPWPWVVALLLSGTVRDLQTPGFESIDMMIDWAFLLLAAAAGRLVHQRHAQAERLASHLELVDGSRREVVDEAVARERAVIARELHDVVAHAVSLIVVQAGTAGPRARRTDAELAEVLTTIEHAGREALVELRRLLGVLRTPGSDEGGGGVALPVPGLPDLPRLVERARSAGLDVDLSAAPLDGVAPGVALCAYRVVQEGLTNALRHSPSRRARVTLEPAQGALAVRVETDGGAAPGDLDGAGAGVGLVGLRERVLPLRDEAAATVGPA
jgi:signal transduction histidine kinase